MPIAGLLALSACASVPPVPRQIDNRFEFRFFEPDSVFTAAMAVFGEVGYPIDNLEPSFRIVRSDWMRATFPEQFDCGRVGLVDGNAEPVALLSVFIGEVGEAAVMTVNAQFQRSPAYAGYETIDCVSTGLLEWGFYWSVSEKLGVPDRLRYPRPEVPGERPSIEEIQQRLRESGCDPAVSGRCRAPSPDSTPSAELEPTPQPRRQGPRRPLP